MKVTFIVPHIGKKPNKKYLRTWQMEPLSIATLSALTPKEVDREFFDERIEEIDFNTNTDLVAITVETYTAKRAYEIAAEFHKRNIPTIFGGYHVMLAPEEAKQYSNSVLIGYAEGVWEDVIENAANNKLKKVYSGKPLNEVEFVLPDRSIFKGKNYQKLHCIETTRGCPFKCNFCAIAAATESKCIHKPVDLIIEEIKQLDHRNIFFVDDNIVGNFQQSEELFKRLIPLNVKWFSQGSLNISRNKNMLGLMRDSGCVGLLVGFESFNPTTLKNMDKDPNISFKGDYQKAVQEFSNHNIGLYATFVFGYDSDTYEDCVETVKRAIDLKFMVAAFNHLIPFPGTPLYKTLLDQNKLTVKDWWLDPNFKYGDTPIIPKNFTSKELADFCVQARKEFYSLKYILKRASNRKGNINSLPKLYLYAYMNFFLGKEIDDRYGLPLGNVDNTPEPMKAIKS